MSAVCDRKIYNVMLGSRSLELGRRTLLMGILNITPDSFSDGGKFSDFDRASARAFELIEAGADILDVGGESTRPGSAPVPLDLELGRVIPIIKAVRERSDIPISVDTNKAEVASLAIEAGADIINDVSALGFDPEMAAVAAKTGAPVILMHMLGVPRTMQVDPFYESVISEVIAFLEERMKFAVQNGIKRSQIIVDPGIGFGKTITHNLRIVRDFDSFACMDRPLLLAYRAKDLSALYWTGPKRKESLAPPWSTRLAWRRALIFYGCMMLLFIKKRLKWPKRSEMDTLSLNRMSFGNFVAFFLLLRRKLWESSLGPTE